MKNLMALLSLMYLSAPSQADSYTAQEKPEPNALVVQQKLLLEPKLSLAMEVDD